jgi:arylsulfatase A-like enzyme
MFLRPYELVPLYATEWLILSFFGLAATFLCCVLDYLAVRFAARLPPGSGSRIGFAVVIAIALFFGGYAWISTITHSPPPVHRWVPLLLALIFAAGVIAGFGLLHNELRSIEKLARFLSLAGSVTLLSLIFTASFGSATEAERNPPNPQNRKPNIVLLTIDTLAATHLQPYGSSRPTSPNIQEFSQHSIVFEQFHANANFTTTGIATMLNGVPPWTHRVLQLQGKAGSRWTSESIPARLHAAGYLTAYFGSNSYAGGRFQGVSRFFDHKDTEIDWVFGPCFDRLADLLPYLCATAENGLIAYSYLAIEHAAARLGLISLYPHSDVSAMIGRVLRWCELASKQGRPIFLWVHLFPPHDPYAAPAPWLRRFDSSSAASTPMDSHPALQFEAQVQTAKRLETLQARYDESILFVDHFVGLLLSGIRRDFGANTAILLSADHGESFNHGYGSHGGVMLYEDLIHIPLIVSLPDGPAERRHDLASQIDIAPTIAAIAKIPPSAQWVGKALTEWPETDDRIVYAMNFEENSSRDRLSTGSVAALHSNWKFVRFFGKPIYPNEPPLRDQLFDLGIDPQEHQNVASEYPDITAALAAEISQQLSIHGGPIENR